MITHTTSRRAALALLGGLLAAALFTLAPAQADAQTTLKLATLAPAGSDWEKSFRAAEKAIGEKTGGQVQIKIYAGGVMGDERAMVKKMRTGQLDAGAVTGVGLGDINAELLALQLPFLFRNYQELSAVRERMSATLERLLNEKGFVLLTWGDVGFQFLFSNTPITSMADARKAKMWVWDADPISKEVMKVANINATPLGVPDVLPSLTTGLVDAFLNSPYGAVALQWSEKAKYIVDVRLAFVTGGVVISKASWDKLTPEQQTAVREVFKAEGEKLITKIQSANDSAQKTLVSKKGYTPTQLTDINDWIKMGDTVRANLTGKVFSQAVIDELLGHIKAVRK